MVIYIYIIGKVLKEVSGFREVQVISTENSKDLSSFEGKIYLTSENIKVGTTHVFRLNSVGMFCFIVPLSKIKKAGVE